MCNVPRFVVLACAIALLPSIRSSASQVPAAPVPAAPTASLDKYHSPQELAAAFHNLAKSQPARAAVHVIAKSPGGLDVLALEVGPEVGAKTRRVPAVLVVANPEGVTPLAGEAALFVASQLVSRPDLTRELTWFVVPALNPDAARRFFGAPLVADERNATRHNDDTDDQVDEDGPEDLNGDGLITQMRVKDPAGEWIAVSGNPRLLKKADSVKGEKGVYRLYSEGIDNDGDGEINEDPPGGRNIGITFPHLFKPFQTTSGGWPGQEPETFGMLQFVIAHPEIAMTMTFGATNFCLTPPRGGRQGTADFTQIKIPEKIASRFGADPAKTYTMDEIKAMVQPMLPPGMELTESMIASFLGLGAVVNPLDDDLKIYKELSDRYKEFLKAVKLDAKRVEPAADKDGAFELWSYYHLGVPTFTMDFWTAPEPEDAKTEKTGITADSLETMTNEAFIALGEPKLTAFLKEVGAPPNIAAKMLLQGVESGSMSPRQMAGMLRQMPKPVDTSGGDPKVKALLAFSDKELQGKGFAVWAPFKHPVLGEVEIGGAVPFADTTPPASMIKTLIEGQAPWVFKLAERLPRMKIATTESTAKGGGIYELTVWVQNGGYLPFPTAMGKRNQRVPPAIVTVKGTGLTFLSGRARTPVTDVGGSAAVKLQWLVRLEKPGTIDVMLESANAWNDAATVRLGGAR